MLCYRCSSVLSIDCMILCHGQTSNIKVVFHISATWGQEDTSRHWKRHTVSMLAIS